MLLTDLSLAADRVLLFWRCARSTRGLAADAAWPWFWAVLISWQLVVVVMRCYFGRLFVCSFLTAEQQ